MSNTNATRRAVYVCTRKRCSQYHIEVMGMPTADVRLATGNSACCGACGEVMTFRRFHEDAPAEGKLCVVSYDQVAADELYLGFTVTGLAAQNAARLSIADFYARAVRSPQPTVGMDVVVLEVGGFVYFTAQTGSIDLELPQAPSNYHRYKLPRRSLAKIERALEAATVGSSGLEYPSAFLRWLDANEVKS